MVINTESAGKLAELFKRAGLACEIEAGAIGLVVYGASPAVVRAVMRSLNTTIRTHNPKTKVVVSEVAKDIDEPEATAFWGTLSFDWKAV